MSQDQPQNTTAYVHPRDPNLNRLESVMEYSDGVQPHLRVSLGSDNITISGNVNIADHITVDNTTANPVPVTIQNSELEIKNDANNPIPISRTTSANASNNPLYVNFTNSTIGVTGDFYQATQPVSGTVTIQDGGNTITVDGTVTANVTFPTTQQVSGTVALDTATLTALENVGVTGTVELGTTTLAALENTTVTISGTPTVNIGTIPEVEIKNDTGNPIPITGSVNIIATPGGASFEFTSKNRLKVSTYQSVFFNTFQYSKETDVWDESTTNGATATYNANQSNVIMAVTSTLGSEVIRQTFNVQRYIPGRTSTLNFAIRMQTPVAGIRRRLGLFDERDGCFFEDSGDNYYCVLRSYASGALVEDRVARADWNGDKLDGTGSSGIVANPEAIHMFGVEYEWYGAGQVKFVYIIKGVSHTIHTFNTANEKSLPWCTTPFLPIRLELTNVTGVAGTHYLYQGSNSLISEGTPEKLGIGMNITSPVAGTGLTTKELFYPVLSIRLKSNGLRGIVLPVFFQVATTDNTTIFYKLVRNATLGTGGNGWTDHPDANAFTQYQTYTSPSAISEVNQGRSIDSGFVMSGGGGTGVRMDKDTVYQMGRSGMGTVSDTLTLLVSSTVSNKTAIASMTWIEQR